MAEAIFRHRAREAGIDAECDSAGTGAWHAGEPPHAGTRSELGRNGVDASGMVARQVSDEDFFEFDLILAMDASNFSDLQDAQLPNGTAQLAMLLDWHPDVADRDVPDPYYAGGFDEVYELIDTAIGELLDGIEAGNLEPPARRS